MYMVQDIRKSIELVVFDFDGVLTDNRVLVSENGLEAVVCNRADGLAFDMLNTAQLPTMILSTENNPVVSVRATKLRVPVLQGIKDKRQELIDHCHEVGVDLANVMFIGNDLNDISVMRVVGYPVAVADAHPEVKNIAWKILSTNGGDGVAREIVERVLGLEYGGSEQVIERT